MWKNLLYLQPSKQHTSDHGKERKPGTGNYGMH